MTDRTIIIRQGPQRRIIRGGGSTFNPAESQDITASWSFTLDEGQTHIISDNPADLTTATFWSFDSNKGTTGIVGPENVASFKVYTDGVSTSAGWYWLIDPATGASQHYICNSSNPSGTVTDVAVLDNAGFGQRAMGHTVISGLFTRYANLAAINAAITAPSADMNVMLNGEGLLEYNGTNWVHAADGKTLASVSFNLGYLENLTSNVQSQLDGKLAATTTAAGALINGATDKTTPADADYVGLMDSAATNILKKLSWANIKATLKTYFDALYCNQVYSGVYASLESTAAAASNSGKYAWVSDVGMDGSLWRSNGTTWNPVGGKIIVAKNKYAAFNPGSGTISASGSGNITLSAALPAIFDSGVWLYLPAIATTPAITAGWYFCVMTSTTVGTVCGTVQTLPNNSPSTTPITFTVGAGYSGDTNEITCHSISPVANALRVGCTIKGEYAVAKTAGAATWAIRNRFDGTAMNIASGLANTALSERFVASANIISSTTAAAIVTGASSYTVASNALALDTSINLATALAFAFTIDTGNAADNLGILSATVEINYP